MTKLPDDESERRVWLERWAAEQRALHVEQESLRQSVRLRIATVIERQLYRLDPLFDRGLNTGHNTFTAGGHKVASPSPWHVVPRALRKVGASDCDVFIDFGCGTGRVVHQAAKRPLKRVIGVEIFPEVADRARGLVEAQRPTYRCHDVEIVTCDVTRFSVPDDLTIAYFGHVQYFSREVMDAVLRNLIRSLNSRPRRVRLIYYPAPNYREAAPLATGRFRLLPELSFGGVAIFESC